MQYENPQVVYSWKAPLRAYRKRSPFIMRFYFAVAFLVSVIVLLFGDRIVLIPLLALLFLFYVLTTSPPPEVTNDLTVFGVQTSGITLRWESLSEFYYSQKFNYTVLTLVGGAPYYFHAYLIIPNEEVKRRVTEILSKHLMYTQTPRKNFTDKAVDWLSRLIPEEPTREEATSSSTQTPEPSTLLPQKSVPI